MQKYCGQDKVEIKDHMIVKSILQPLFLLKLSGNYWLNITHRILTGKFIFFVNCYFSEFLILKGLGGNDHVKFIYK